MRIVGGKHRGRALIAPTDESIRPTSDRAREALFNILLHGRFAGTALMPETRVLDVFAGTGALALEALSRGAARATLIDKDPKALDLARANAAKLGEQARVTFVRADALHPPRASEAATLLLLDPPYGQSLAAPALAALAAQGWIAAGAFVVVELAATERFEPPPGFAPLDERRYGRAKLAIMSFVAASDR